MSGATVHRLSVVIPVYQGETTLPKVLQELTALTHEQATPDGHRFSVSEVVLVHDCGPDDSATVIERLAKEHPFVVAVWLSRNYGQHPATLAGMASATGNWVVTIDEDGQQNPADIARMLDIALAESADVVYAKPTNAPPHGWLRNTLSAIGKRCAMVLMGKSGLSVFNSFRLMDGEIARSLAAYSGSGVFLDIALFWVVQRVAHCPVKLRSELGRRSGYSLWTLLKHFLRLLLTSGTRPLRLITGLGCASVLLALGIAAYALWVKFHNEVPVQGWTSLVIVVAFFSGCILISLGVIAEYLAQALTIVMGRPLYLIRSAPLKRKR